MAFFHKIVQGGADFLKSFKNENKKQLVELEKLEKKLESLQNKEKKTINNVVFDQKYFLKFWITGVVILLVAYIFFQSLQIIYLIMAAYIMSVAIEAVIEFFEKRIHSRVLSIFLAYLFLLFLVLGGLLFIIPFLLGQVSDIIAVINGNASNIKHLLETNSLAELVKASSWVPDSLKELIIKSLGNSTVSAGLQSQLQDNVNQIVNIGSTYAKDIGSVAINMFGSMMDFITELGIVVTLSVLFSWQKNSVMKFVAGIGGEKDRQYIYMKLQRIYKKLGIWLKSQLLLCFFVGGMMFLSLWIMTLFGMDIPDKISIAFILFLTELVPYFGPLIGGSIAALVAFINFGLPGALIVIGIVFLINWIENNILIPLLMNKTLGVNPVVIFISMIMGGFVIGFVGVLLAVPISVIVTLLIDKNFED